MRIWLTLLFLFGFQLVWGQEWIANRKFNLEDGLPQVTVFCINEDSLGRIWVGTAKGLVAYNGYEFLPTPINKEKVFDIHVKGQFIFVTTTTGIIKMNVVTFESEKYTFPKIRYQRPKYSKEGIRLVEEGKTMSLDYNLKPIKDDNRNLEKPSISELEIRKIWEAQGGATVNQIIKGSRNTFLSVTYEGLFEWKKKENVWQFEKKINGSYECVYLDKNENIWLGTANNGLEMVHRNNYHFQSSTITDSGQPVESCWTIFEWEGAIHVCTDKGLKRLDGKETRLTESTKNLYCVSAFVDSNQVYIGTRRLGMFRANDQGCFKISSETNTSNSTFVQILKTENGILFVEKNSLILLNDKGTAVKKYLSIPYEKASSIFYVQATKRGYAIANVKGITLCDKNFDQFQLLQTESTYCFTMIQPYKEGYACTSLEGYVYYLKGEKLTQISKKPNPALTLSRPINNTFWMTTLGGLDYFMNGKILNLNAENGVPIKEFNQAGLYYSTATKTFYCSGLNAVMWFKDTDIDKAFSFPTVHVMQEGEPLKWNETYTYDFDIGTLTISIERIKTVDQNIFQVEFFDGAKWQRIDKNGALNCRLQYGENHFKIRQTNIFSEEIKMDEFMIVRDVPIWQRWWFFVLLAGLLGLVVGGIYLLLKFNKTRKELKIQLEERKLSDERMRISRELHDNIGARITHIISSLDIEAYRNAETSSIDKISNFARETMTQLRETIWAVSAKEIAFSQFVHRIEQYVTQVNHLSELEIAASKDEHLPDFQLSPAQLINYYRTIQEAINNAVKYANASAIWIDFHYLKDKRIIRVEVQDDGIGFDLSKEKYGTGIKSMRARMEEVGGEIEVLSEEGKGTTIVLFIPLNR